MTATSAAPILPGQPEPRRTGEKPVPQTSPASGRVFTSKKVATYGGGACRKAACRARKEAELNARLERAPQAVGAFIETLADLHGREGGRAGS